MIVKQIFKTKEGWIKELETTAEKERDVLQMRYRKMVFHHPSKRTAEFYTGVELTADLGPRIEKEFTLESVEQVYILKYKEI
jgi:hypothetical protein